MVLRGSSEYSTFLFQVVLCEAKSKVLLNHSSVWENLGNLPCVGTPPYRPEIAYSSLHVSLAQFSGGGCYSLPKQENNSWLSKVTEHFGKEPTVPWEVVDLGGQGVKHYFFL